jgi:hypothetical protein
MALCDRAALWPHLSDWERQARTAFLDGYVAVVGDSPGYPPDPDQVKVLLELFTLEKACYELRYELDHRPIGPKFRSGDYANCCHHKRKKRRAENLSNWVTTNGQDSFPSDEGMLERTIALDDSEVLQKPTGRFDHRPRRDGCAGELIENAAIPFDLPLL